MQILLEYLSSGTIYLLAWYETNQILCAGTGTSSSSTGISSGVSVYFVCVGVHFNDEIQKYLVVIHGNRRVIIKYYEIHIQ